jgi:hypothetical protein
LLCTHIITCARWVGVWIGGGGNTEEGLCLQLSFDFIHGILCGRGVGNLPPWDKMKEYNWIEVDFMRTTRNGQSWASTEWLQECSAKGLNEKDVIEILQNKKRGGGVSLTTSEGDVEERGATERSREVEGGRKTPKKKKVKRWATASHLNKAITRSMSAKNKMRGVS